MIEIPFSNEEEKKAKDLPVSFLEARTKDPSIPITVKGEKAREELDVFNTQLRNEDAAAIERENDYDRLTKSIIAVPSTSLQEDKYRVNAIREGTDFHLADVYNMMGDAVNKGIDLIQDADKVKAIKPFMDIIDLESGPETQAAILSGYIERDLANRAKQLEGTIGLMLADFDEFSDLFGIFETELTPQEKAEFALGKTNPGAFDISDPESGQFLDLPYSKENLALPIHDRDAIQKFTGWIPFIGDGINQRYYQNQYADLYHAVHLEGKFSDKNPVIAKRIDFLRNKIGSFGEKGLLEGFGSLIMQIKDPLTAGFTVGALTKNPKAALAAGLAQTFSQTYKWEAAGFHEEVIARAAEKGITLDPTVTANYAAIYGILSAGTETVSNYALSKIAKLAIPPKLRQKIFSWWGKPASSVKASIWKELGIGVGVSILSTGQEVGEELIQLGLKEKGRKDLLSKFALDGQDIEPVWDAFVRQAPQTAIDTIKETALFSGGLGSVRTSSAYLDAKSQHSAFIGRQLGYDEVTSISEKTGKDRQEAVVDYINGMKIRAKKEGKPTETSVYIDKQVFTEFIEKANEEQVQKIEEMIGKDLDTLQEENKDNVSIKVDLAQLLSFEDVETFNSLNKLSSNRRFGRSVVFYLDENNIKDVRTESDLLADFEFGGADVVAKVDKLRFNIANSLGQFSEESKMGKDLARLGITPQEAADAMASQVFNNIRNISKWTGRDITEVANAFFIGLGDIEVKNFFDDKTKIIHDNTISFVKNDEFLGGVNFAKEPGGTSSISLFHKADLNTVLEEFQHIYFKGVQDYINSLVDDKGQVRGDIGKVDSEGVLELKQSVDALEDWASDNGRITDRMEIEENKVDAFEEYLKEGKAPSQETEEAVDRFASWVADSYKSTFTRPAVELNNETRKAMDTFLASREAIDSYAATKELMFDRAGLAEAGATEEQIKEVNSKVRKLLDGKKRDLFSKLTALEKKYLKRWEKQRDAIFDALPTTRLFKYLRENKLKLALSDLRENREVNQEKLEELYAKDKGRSLFKVDGLSPEIAVKEAGFEDVAQMMRNVFDLFTDPYTGEIRKSTDREIKDQIYRKIKYRAFSDALSIEQTKKDIVNAEDHIELETSGRILDTYAEIFAELNKEFSVKSRAEMVKIANRFVRESSLDELNLETLERDADDLRTNIRSMTMTPGNYYIRNGERTLGMINELRQISILIAKVRPKKLKHDETWNIIVEELNRKDSKQMTPTAHDIMYQDAKRYGPEEVRNSLHQKEIGYQFSPVKLSEYLDEWKSFLDTTAFDVQVPSWLDKRIDPDKSLWTNKQKSDAKNNVGLNLDKNFTTTQMAIPQMEAFLRNMRVVLLKEDSVAKARREAAANSIINSLSRFKDFVLLDTFPGEGLLSKGKKVAKRAFNFYTGGSTSQRYLMKHFDGTSEKEVGISERTMHVPLHNGALRAAVVTQLIANPVRSLTSVMSPFSGFVAFTNYINNKLPKAFRESLGIHDTPVIIKDFNNGMEREATAHEVIGLALQAGTEYNRITTEEGNIVGDRNLQDIIDYTFTEEQWDAIQAVWDGLDESWDYIAETYREMYFDSPEKVEATPFTVKILKDGEIVEKKMRGGYFPLHLKMQDQNDTELEVDIKDDFSSVKMEHVGMLGSVDISAPPSTISRVGAGERRVNSDYTTVMARHINYASRFAGYAVPLREIIRTLKETGLDAAIIKKFGNDIMNNPTIGMKKYFRDIAGGNRSLIQTTGVVKMLFNVRNLTTKGYLGLKPSVAGKQILSAPGFIRDVGAKTLADGAKFVYGNLEFGKTYVDRLFNAYNLMLEIDPQMKERSQGSLHAITARPTIRSGTERMIDNALFSMIKGADATLVTPAWWGAYNKKLAETGGNREESKLYATGIIALSQPFNRLIDQTAFQRSYNTSHWYMMLLTMFSGYTSKLSNRFMHVMRRVRAGEIAAIDVFKFYTMEVLFSPVLLRTLALAGYMMADEDDEKFIPTVDRFITGTASDIFSFPLKGIPGLGNAADLLSRNLVFGGAYWDERVSKRDTKEAALLKTARMFGFDSPAMDEVARISQVMNNFFLHFGNAIDLDSGTTFEDLQQTSIEVLKLADFTKGSGVQNSYNLVQDTYEATIDVFKLFTEGAEFDYTPTEFQPERGLLVRSVISILEKLR